MKVLIFGSAGLVGKSLIANLNKSKKVSEVIGSTRDDTNLLNFNETKETIITSKPNVVIIAAAKVGGIYANDTYRTDFILENLKINMNILESCKGNSNIEIINLGSSCIYPLNAPNPINENDFMNGKLEPTNSPYAMAKLTAIEIGRSISEEFGNRILNIMPTNLYGPDDNFHIENSHVIPGLIHRMFIAKKNNDKEFKIWGTGKPLREFLYVDDLSTFIESTIGEDMKYDLYNVGSGEEISIFDLAKKIQKIISYEGIITTDNNKPDGNPRKFIDSSRALETGWRPTVNLDLGLTKTYEWFLENQNNIRI